MSGRWEEEIALIMIVEDDLCAHNRYLLSLFNILHPSEKGGFIRSYFYRSYLNHISWRSFYNKKRLETVKSWFVWNSHFVRFGFSLSQRTFGKILHSFFRQILTWTSLRVEFKIVTDGRFLFGPIFVKNISCHLSS